MIYCSLIIIWMLDFYESVFVSRGLPLVTLLRLCIVSSYSPLGSPLCGCSSRGLLCRICNVFAHRVRIGWLLLLAKGNRGGGLSPINTLNIGSNKRNVTNLLD